jgi:hypothetical protein
LLDVKSSHAVLRPRKKSARSIAGASCGSRAGGVRLPATPMCANMDRLSRKRNLKG